MIKQIRLTALFIFMMFSSMAFAAPHIVKASLVNWMVEDSGYQVNPQTARLIANSVIKHAEKEGLDPYLVLSLIENESGYRPTVKNSYGATGLMQVVPRYHKKKIKGRSLTNIDTNIEVGTKVLAGYIDDNKGSLKKALRYYSGNAKKYEQKLQRTRAKIKRSVVAFRFQNEHPIQVASL